MNKYSVTNGSLLRCLKTVQKHCDSRDLWRGKSFNKFCSKPRNVYHLEVLETKSALSISHYNGMDINGDIVKVYDYVVLDPKAADIRIENQEKWKDRLWGFIVGVLVSVAASIIGKMLGGL